MGKEVAAQETNPGSDSGGHGPFLTGICAWQRIHLIRPLQTLRSVEPIAKIISEAPILLVSLWIIWYWCVDPRGAVRGIFLVPICEISNAILKQYFRHPRPGWIREHPVEYKQWSAEYSFPSSDMQLVASNAIYLFGRHPVHLVVVLVIVGVNRLHRGAHYLHDVVAGTVVGLLLTYTYIRFGFEDMLENMTYSLSTRLLTILCSLPLVAMKFLVGHRASAATAQPDPVAWEKKANSGREKFRSLDTDEGHMKQFSGMYGLFVAFALTNPRPDELMELPRNSREFYGRIVFGQMVVIGVFLGIASISPKTPPLMMHVFRSIQYASVPIVTYFLSPPIFKSLGLLSEEATMHIE